MQKQRAEVLCIPFTQLKRWIINAARLHAGSCWWRRVGQRREEGEDALLLLQSALRETHHCWIIYTSRRSHRHTLQLSKCWTVLSCRLRHEGYDLCKIEVTSKYSRCPEEKMGKDKSYVTLKWARDILRRRNMTKKQKRSNTTKTCQSSFYNAILLCKTLYVSF